MIRNTQRAASHDIEPAKEELPGRPKYLLALSDDEPEITEGARPLRHPTDVDLDRIDPTRIERWF